MFPDAENRIAIRSTSAGPIFAETDQYLVLLDGTSGQILWQTKYKGSAQSLVADAERAYLSSGWWLSAYDLVSGQQLWQRDDQETHTAYELYLWEDILFQYSTSRKGDVIDKIDPATGYKLNTEVIPRSVGEPNIDVPLEEVNLCKDSHFVWAIERQSNKVLWRIPNLGPIATPVVVGDLLVTAVGRVKLELLVLKLDTGEILWRKPGVVSNPVVILNTIYVIALDGSISAYELSNGHEIGSLVMNPAVTIADKHVYALVADEENGVLYAYYGDSQELIALGP